jgi:hypothetical protein
MQQVHQLTSSGYQSVPRIVRERSFSPHFPKVQPAFRGIPHLGEYFPALETGCPNRHRRLCLGPRLSVTATG